MANRLFHGLTLACVVGLALSCGAGDDGGGGEGRAGAGAGGETGIGGSGGAGGESPGGTGGEAGAGGVGGEAGAAGGAGGSGGRGEPGGGGGGPRPLPRAIAGGDYHSCRIGAHQTVSCWGRNQSGQLGNGELFVGTATPQRLEGLDSIAEIALGQEHSCALSLLGKVYCWGDNGSRQVTGELSIPVPAPVEVDLPDMAIGICTGAGHSCARLMEGGVLCWGANGSGQLGDGTTQSKAGFVSVLGITERVRDLACGGRHTCALLGDGSVVCWGMNYNNQLGNDAPPFLDPEPAPVEVVGLPGPARAVEAKDNHSCAILEDDTLWCWGRNADKQLHPDLAGLLATATQVPGVADVSSFATGFRHSCVLFKDQSLVCWGQPIQNDFGQYDPPPLGPVSLIAAGSHHSCAITVEGETICWGNDTYGQLGDF